MGHILVVDDEPDVRALVALNLRIDGHHVSTAIDGDDALASAASLRPDLILLDLSMPGMDGFSVLKRLKADDSGMAEIPVIVASGKSDRMDRIRGGIEGAVAFVAKPFSVRVLRHTVAAVLAGGPEPDLRLQAQLQALTDLARLESGNPSPDSAPRPRLTRLEPQGPPSLRTSLTERFDRSLYSPRQLEIADAVSVAPSLTAAAQELGVSRTYLYVALRNMAERSGLSSGPELARLLRSADTPARR